MLFYVSVFRYDLRQLLSIWHAPGEPGMASIDGFLLDMLCHERSHSLYEHRSMSKFPAYYVEYFLHISFCEIHRKPFYDDQHRFTCILYHVSPFAVHGGFRYLVHRSVLLQELCPYSHGLREINVVPAFISALISVTAGIKTAGDIHNHSTLVLFQVF